jgi:hypothetical protein
MTGQKVISREMSDVVSFNQVSEILIAVKDWRLFAARDFRSSKLLMSKIC